MAIKLVSYNGGLYAINYNGGLGAIYEEEAPVVVARTITFSGSYGTWSSSSLTAYDGDYLSASGKTVTCKIGGSTGSTRWTNTFTLNSSTPSYLYEFLGLNNATGTISGNRTVSTSTTYYNIPNSYTIYLNTYYNSLSDFEDAMYNAHGYVLDCVDTCSLSAIRTTGEDFELGLALIHDGGTTDYINLFLVNENGEPIFADDAIGRIDPSDNYDPFTAGGMASWSQSGAGNAYVAYDSSANGYLIIGAANGDLYDTVMALAGEDIQTAITSLMNDDNIGFVAVLSEITTTQATIYVYKN